MLFSLASHGYATGVQTLPDTDNQVITESENIDSNNSENTNNDSASEDVENEDTEATESKTPESTVEGKSENTEGENSDKTEGDAPENTEGEESKTVEGEDSEKTESDTSENAEGEDTENIEGEDTEMTESEESETPEEEENPIKSDEVEVEDEEESFAQQLQTLGSLKEIFDAMMADAEAVYALTLEEITALKAYTQSLYDAIEEPTEDDDEYLDLIMDTFLLLEGELTHPELLDDTAKVSRNASRMFLTGAESCQWQRSADDISYEDIPEAIGTTYDLTAADSHMYIRAKTGENTYTAPVKLNGFVAVFDISKGNVSLNTTYSGKNKDGETVSGTHAAENIYVVMQSDSAMTVHNIIFGGNHPDSHFHVTLGGVNMGETPSNHNQSPGSSGSNTPGNGKISIPATSDAVKNVTLYLQGENVVRNITYYNGGDTNLPANVASSLKITSINGDGAVSGDSLYVPQKLSDGEIAAFVASKTNYNHWNAGIGGTDSASLVQNLHIAGGRVQVVTTLGDNCTAIGAGGNGYGHVTITGGEVIAHCNGTGAAIGGGIGWNAKGGTSNVLISGGYVYAKNHAMIADGANYVGGVAIGSGSSFYKDGTEGKVTITGGTVYAYGTFGNGIGGGNSSTSKGGAATIDISGGAVMATSIGGGNSKTGAGGDATVTVSGGANVTLEKGIGGGLSENGVGGTATINVNGGSLDAAGTIGGGTGGGTGNGGGATVNVTGGVLTAQSIGGGTGSVGGHGGAATIDISGGTIVTGSIGGGSTLNPTGKLGYAKATITGGDISGQFLLMAGGTEPCYFNMSGGILHGVNAADEKYTMKDGAAVYMDDPIGLVEISGGTIQDCSAKNGGAVYMTAGTFNMSGSAVISNCTAAENGGAVYLGSSGSNTGTFNMSGGVIGLTSADNGEGVTTVIGSPNSAKNGGAVYIDGGNLNISGGSIAGNTAAENGGGAYVNGGSVVIYGTAQVSGNIAGSNGGGIAVNNGNFSMEGGNVDRNLAVGGNGGGIYVSSNSSQTVTVNVLSGSVSNNQSGSSGGALAVRGASGNPILVTVGVNDDHVTAGYPEHGSHGSYTCPLINNNSSNSAGGAIFVTGSKQAKLCIYCMTEEGNVAGDTSKPSDFMMVEGGTVEITTEKPNTAEAAQDGIDGHTVIRNKIYVVGGDVDIWGTMTNPDISNIITVDIKDGYNDDFDDHRIVGSGGTEYYKLLYYENFTDPATGATTGLYQQTRVQKGQTVTIDGFIYKHTGYEIGGWNTDHKNEVTTFATHKPADLQEGQGFINEGWYNCREDYLFDGTYRTHLTLYAIWNPIGYAIMFNPNAGENGEYTGYMEDMSLKYDEEKELTENAFGRPGYYFLKWNREPDGSGASYNDKALVKNLSSQVGSPVTLYAQWMPCNHDPDEQDYTYTVQDNVLTGECACKGCTVTATVQASDTTYDQKLHKAELEITISASVEESVAAKLRNFTLVYEQKTAEDTWTKMESGKYPINAGDYRVSITVGDQVASKEYSIKKASQTAPPKPEYLTNKEDSSIAIDKLVVQPVQESELHNTDKADAESGKFGYDGHVEYAVVYDQGDGTQSEPVWQTGTEMTLNAALTNYYVLVRYSETSNYEASAPTRADSKYFFAGNVSIIVHGVEGVDYSLKEATMDSENVVTGVELTLKIVNGYYFPGDYTVNNITVNPEANGPLIAVRKTDKGDSVTWIYGITDIQKESSIDIYLNPVKKLPTVQSFVTEGQVFTDFDDTEAIISRDSAYTARFVVENFDWGAYEGKIVFTGLSAGTPMILIKKASGLSTYYRADASGEVELKNFIEMGTQSTGFSLGENEQDVTLQLIARHGSGEYVETKLLLEPIVDKQPNASKVSDKVRTELKPEANFEISSNEETIRLKYDPSAGVASIWDRRDNALVLRAKEGTTLPDDARLKYSDGNFNRECSVNPEGEFIIPLGQLKSDEVKLSFSIITLMQTGNYDLEAEWYVACSQAETSPKNGVYAGKTAITLSAEKSDVSLKISAEEHLFHTGEVLDADINVKGIEGYTTKLDLQRKVGDEYQSVDVAKTITGALTQSYELNYEPGSYRLYLYSYTSYSREETSFYFIIQ